MPVRELPWNDRFDAAILYDTMHHFDDEVATLEVILTALVPGGRIYIREGARPAPGSEGERQLVEEMELYGTLESPFDPAYLEEVVTKAGFTDVRRFVGGRRAGRGRRRRQAVGVRASWVSYRAAAGCPRRTSLIASQARAAAPSERGVSRRRSPATARGGRTARTPPRALRAHPEHGRHLLADVVPFGHGVVTIGPYVPLPRWIAARAPTRCAPACGSARRRARPSSLPSSDTRQATPTRSRSTRPRGHRVVLGPGLEPARRAGRGADRGAMRIVVDVTPLRQPADRDRQLPPSGCCAGSPRPPAASTSSWRSPSGPRGRAGSARRSRACRRAARTSSAAVRADVENRVEPARLPAGRAARRDRSTSSTSRTGCTRRSAAACARRRPRPRAAALPGVGRRRAPAAMHGPKYENAARDVRP